jgi:hypothetical protein
MIVTILMMLGVCGIGLTLILAVLTFTSPVSVNMLKRHNAVNKFWQGAKTYPKF